MSAGGDSPEMGGYPHESLGGGGIHGPPRLSHCWGGSGAVRHHMPTRDEMDGCGLPRINSLDKQHLLRIQRMSGGEIHPSQAVIKGGLAGAQGPTAPHRTAEPAAPHPAPHCPPVPPSRCPPQGSPPPHGVGGLIAHSPHAYLRHPLTNRHLNQTISWPPPLTFLMY